MTELTPKQKTSSIEWSLWFQWVLATTLGWIIGWGFIGEAGIGVVIGIAQWLVLRRLGYQAGWWIWASTVGWAVGWALIVTGLIVPPEGGVLASLAAGAVLGVTIGVAQWLVLRRFVYQASWWMLASTVGWMVGLTGVFGGTVAGVLAGAMTGFMLDWQLRYFPKPAENQHDKEEEMW